MTLLAGKAPRSVLVGVWLVAGLLAVGCDKQAPEAGKGDAPAAKPEPAKAEPAAPAEPAAAEPAAAPAEPAAAAEPAAEAEPAAVDYNGTYKNSGGAKLTIEDFVAGEGFGFQLVIESGDDCDSVDYRGKAKLSGDNAASSGEGDSFKLDNGKIELEPSVEMIGMDCARVLDTEFKK